uniref:NELL2-interacting cell ontogeny regulator 1 n=1 Tax=Meleagris gallopavo TaxID=9103 RepID=A0A803XM45_MELGA
MPKPSSEPGGCWHIPSSSFLCLPPDSPLLMSFFLFHFPGRPCVDCHAFEFMQRALQDLKKMAYNLDTRTETLLLKAEKRGLCDCFPAMH